MRFIEKLHRRDTIKNIFDNRSIVIVLSGSTDKKAHSVKGTILNKSISTEKVDFPFIKSGCQLLVVKNGSFKDLTSKTEGAIIVKWGSKVYTYKALKKLKRLSTNEVIIDSIQSMSNNLRQINQLIPKCAIDLCAIPNRMAKDCRL
jgi:tRNA G10  N-methylase Trm11